MTGRGWWPALRARRRRHHPVGGADPRHPVTERRDPARLTPTERCSPPALRARLMSPGWRSPASIPTPKSNIEEARDTPHWAFGGTVPLELSGKRQRRIDVATATLALTDADTARAIARTSAADVRRAYYQAVASLRRVAIAQELEAIATRARDAAQERFQAGAAPRLEALQAGLALSQAQNDVAAAQGDVAAARADLNALLGLSRSTPRRRSPIRSRPVRCPRRRPRPQQAIAGNAELRSCRSRSTKRAPRSNSPRRCAGRIPR